MPADLGPAPHRSVSGSWGPGEDTELIHLPQAPTTVDENHWPAASPSALMIVAQLGSLTADEYEMLWLTERDGKPGDGFWFAAQRSADGTTVSLRHGVSDGLPGNEGGATVEWRGADHAYAWAARWTGLQDFSSAAIRATARCEVATGTVSASGESGGMVFQAWGNSGFVPSGAKSDARVLYVASWWKLPSPEAPTVAQLEARLKAETCRRWFVGFVGARG